MALPRSLPSLPPADTPFLDESGKLSRAWYEYLSAQRAALVAILTDVDDRLVGGGL